MALSQYRRQNLLCTALDDGHMDHGLGQLGPSLLASAVVLSMDNEHGTDYLQHFVQQNLRYARSSVS